MEQEVERIIKYTKKRKLSSIQKKKHVFYGMNKFKNIERNSNYIWYCGHLQNYELWGLQLLLSTY